MIQVADNFNYRGKKPNFDRDSFDTLQDMKNYSENSLDDGHISYCKETDKRYKFNSNNQSDPTTGKWVEQHEAVPADEEDITEQNGTLQLANKTYDKQSFSGLGRVYLRKNIVGDKNVLTQAMINKANTIYVIQYDYDLKEASINIPENCVLQFDGGSLSNGNVIGNGTSIESSSKYVSILNVTLSGNWKINDGYPEWFGAIGDGIADDRNAIQTAVDNCNTVHFRNTKYKLGIIYYQAGQQGNLFISKNVKLLGDNTELILEGKGQIFTRKGYSEHSPVYDKFKVNPKELIVENVNYLSNIIKVNNAHRFNVGDTILIRGEDSRINTDYEEGVASFKHCANINIDNIVHKFSYSNNVNYGSIQLWGVKNCYIGKIIRHDCGITQNIHTVRILSAEGANYNIYAELLDFTTDLDTKKNISIVYGDNIYINKCKITCKYLDNVLVTGINTKVNYYEINSFSRTINNVKHISNLSQVFNNKTIYNEILLIYNDVENNRRHYYSFNINKVICSKTYAAIDDKSRAITDDIFNSGSLCLVGASVNTTFSDINVKLTSQPEIVIEYIKSSNNQYSNVVSFLFTEDSKSKRDFYLSTNKDSEISKENPLIVTLFFTPLYHLTQILDGDKNWEINNGGYTKDIISINNYPFAYLENSNIVNNYRETLNKNIGNTSNRPIEASKGFQYFDTTINKPIFWDGTKWIDATGATV